jgi:amino acid transporter
MGSLNTPNLRLDLIRNFRYYTKIPYIYIYIYIYIYREREREREREYRVANHLFLFSMNPLPFLSFFSFSFLLLLLLFFFVYCFSKYGFKHVKCELLVTKETVLLVLPESRVVDFMGSVQNLHPIQCQVWPSLAHDQS